MPKCPSPPRLARPSGFFPVQMVPTDAAAGRCVGVLDHLDPHCDLILLLPDLTFKLGGGCVDSRKILQESTRDILTLQEGKKK